MNNILNSKNDLKSPHARELAVSLSNIQIKVIEENQNLGGMEVADKLKTLRNAVWGN